jgi:hypothetical protein
VAEVVIKYVDNYKEKQFEYKINNKPFKPLRKNYIEFEKEDYADGSVNVMIKSVHGSKVEHFTADTIPVSFAVVFGRRIDEAYPEVIKHLLDRMDRMDIVLANMIDAMEEVDKKGDLF